MIAAAAMGWVLRQARRASGRADRPEPARRPVPDAALSARPLASADA